MSAERVMKLVMLASSPNENEARTAAFLACKAIREGKLLVLSPDDPRLRVRPAPPPPPPPRPEPPPRQAYQDAKAKAKERKRIFLKFDGWCRTCRKDLGEGTAAWWASGEGVICERCYR